MKTSPNSPGFKSAANVRQAIAILVAVTSLNLFVSSLPGVFASPRPEAAVAAGMIRVAGTVTVDGERITSGQTIFPGSRIATSERSESIIHLEKLTRLLLGEKTEFTLDFSRTNVSGSLSKGVVRAFIPAGIPVNITTAGAELVTDSSQPAAFVVQVDGHTTKVSVETGRVKLRTGNKLQSLGAGQVFATADSSSQTTKQNNLSNRDRVGILAAIGLAAVILAVAIMGPEEKEPDFGGCVIVPSGTTDQSGICP